MKTTDQPIIISDTYAASADRVWRAISDLNQMRQWYFEMLPDFQAVTGFETDFLITNEGRQFHHHWRVTDVVPGERLTYEWVVDGYPGRSVTIWDLKAGEGTTTLTLTCNILEDFPGDIPEFKRESGFAGWTFFIKEQLKDFLENGA